MTPQQHSSPVGASQQASLSSPPTGRTEEGDRPIYLYLLRHAEGSHNKGAKERKPGQSRTSIFRSPEHFDARLSAKGKAQCADAAARMPAPLRAALAARLGDTTDLPGKAVKESHENSTGDNTEDDTEEKRARGEGSDRGSEEAGAAGQEGERKSVHLEKFSVVLCTSTLRRALETGHLVVQRAVDILRNEEEQKTDEGRARDAESMRDKTTEGEESEGGLTVQTIPTFAIEDLREWSGGGHICDGRHSTRELREFCAPRFSNLSFIVDKDEDALPPSMPRESRADVERRCFAFLRFLVSLATETSPLVCPSLSTSASPSGFASEPHSPRQRRRLSSSLSSLSSFSSPSPAPLHVMCVVHSAWTRHLLAALGLFDPSERGLKNCEWRRISTSVAKLRRALQKVCLPPAPPLPASLARPRRFPLSLQAASSPSESPSLLAGSLRESSGIAETRTVPSLAEFLDAVPRDPFSLLVFPPSAAVDVASDRACKDAPSAMSRGSLSLAVRRAEEAIRAWSQLHQYVPELGKKRRTNENRREAAGCEGKEGSDGKQTETAASPPFAERRRQLEEELARLRLLDSEEGRRREVVTDATMCLRPVNEDTETGRWEVVAKERVHRQACLLLVFPRAVEATERHVAECAPPAGAPSSPSAGEETAGAFLPPNRQSSESPEEAETAEREREEEIFDICSNLLPSTSGVDVVYRLNILSL
uniref:Phosphoglycerate mutase family protein n=1 Tax=Neospora caninum (strain Liverpool) TaxID=572307 RepID=A0A0F7UD29_NEOCL|nr:TPA: phosphoglycerate mutase family protein [Neospora caninum Liverpool]